jgi:hypothetical protein
VSTRYRATARRISTQEVAERAGVDLDYVSRLVNLGLVVPDGDGTFSEGDARRARLYLGLERAEPGQVLVSQGVVDAVGSAGGSEDVAFTPIGSVLLKGVSQPVRLHSVGRPA